MKCIKCGIREAEIGVFCRECYIPKVKMPKPITITICRDCGKLLVAGKWQKISKEKLSNYLASKIKGDFQRAEVDVDKREAILYYPKDIKYVMPFPLKWEKGLCPECSRAHGGYYEAILQLRGDKRSIEKMKKAFIRYARGKTFITKEEEQHGGINLYVGSSKVLLSFLSENKIKGYKLSRKLHTQKQGKRLYRITVALRV